MYSTEERVCVRFLRLILEHGAPHVVRLGPSIGPLVWKIMNLPGIAWLPSRARQVRFEYGGRCFKARFSHVNRGQLEIVETFGPADGPIVVEVRGLEAAMTLDLEQVLNEHLITPQPMRAA